MKIGAIKFLSFELFMLVGMVYMLVGMVQTATAGTTNVFPFSDNFEGYANLTPLINGTNGWYASSNAAVVQTNVVYTNEGGIKAAMVPPGCDLSNRFVQVNSSNVWATMRARPNLGLFDVLPTNTTAAFGIGTNGLCYVYDGPSGWTDITNAIDGLPVATVASNSWSRFDVYINHSRKTWSLFVNYQLLSTNITFLDTNGSSFSGFDVQGSTFTTNYPTPTNYCDNVEVAYTSSPSLLARTNTWLPIMAALDVTNITRTIWEGQANSSNAFHVQKSAGFLKMLFTNSVTYTNCGVWTNWLAISPPNDESSGEIKTAWLVFSTTNLPATNQPYQATVQVTGSDAFFGINASNSPQYITISLNVQGAPKLYVTPLYLTNSVTVGYRAPGQTFYVANTSTPPRASLAYAVSPVDTNWIAASPSSGSVVDDTNSIALTYSTEALTAGLHTGTVTVTAAAIATQTVAVIMRVNQVPVLSWSAGQYSWTNIITEGETLASFNFDVWNSSAWPTGTMNFAVSDDSDWISLSPPTGTSSGDRQSVAVTYAVTNLSPGVYTSTVTLVGSDDFNGNTASNSPLTIVGHLIVRGKATLVVDTVALSNSILENCNSTSAPAFHVWNGTEMPRGGLYYSVTPQDSWLSVSPSSGIITNGTNAITVIWTTGNRAVGTYKGSIIIDGTDELTGSRANGAPKTINVTMTVLSRTPVNLEKPSIYGVRFIGQTLHSRPGVWQNMDRLTYAFQWQRADNLAGSGMANLSGETASNHVIVVADQGKYMRIAVTATDNLPTPRSTTAYSDLLASDKIVATPDDFNGDGISDLWFFDPSTGMWRASFNANTFVEGQFGSAGMTAVPGDYDGNGMLDLGLYESANGMWHILYLPSGPTINGSLFGGIAEETQATPVPADYDGDGQTDITLYWRGYWAILYSSLNRIVVVAPIGSATATPVPADYDGDGIADLAVYDSGLWTIHNALGQQWSVSFGSSAWLAAPADYDGDNIADLGIFNQASNTWSMLYSSSGTTTNAIFQDALRTFGSSMGDNIPNQGYFDRDQYCDPATIHYSTNGDFTIWCITRTTDTNFIYRGQTYQKSINDWRVSW
ncbi:FG-GAP repeat domain-containing protein [Verrucomicrobiota bacterium]